METYQCLMLEIEGKNKMGILSDIKKGLKGSKEYQEGKAKRKAKRAKSPLGKAVKQVAKDVKSAVKGSKEYQAGKAKRKAVKAKKKEGKTWTKAVKKQKKTGGKTMNELIKARNAAKKGSAEYATAQNQINTAYGSKKVHKADAPKKAAPKKAAPKKKVVTKKPEIGQSYEREEIGQSYETDINGSSEERKYAQGGKVESNPFGWPSRDARNGGKG